MRIRRTLCASAVCLACPLFLGFPRCFLLLLLLLPLLPDFLELYKESRR
jgi:hypothetical protein